MILFNLRVCAEIHNACTLIKKNNYYFNSQIHRDTAGTHGLSHLSVSEVNLVKNPDLLNTVANEMQNCQQLIMSYIKWCRKSHVFWEWMVCIIHLLYTFEHAYYIIITLTYHHVIT